MADDHVVQFPESRDAGITVTNHVGGKGVGGIQRILHHPVAGKRPVIPVFQRDALIRRWVLGEHPLHLQCVAGDRADLELRAVVGAHHGVQQDARADLDFRAAVVLDIVENLHVAAVRLIRLRIQEEDLRNLDTLQCSPAHVSCRLSDRPFGNDCLAAIRHSFVFIVVHDYRSAHPGHDVFAALRGEIVRIAEDIVCAVDAEGGKRCIRIVSPDALERQIGILIVFPLRLALHRPDTEASGGGVDGHLDEIVLERILRSPNSIFYLFCKGRRDRRRDGAAKHQHRQQQREPSL